MSNIALNVKAMMSTEIAELTGKKHFHVMRDIEVIIEQLDEVKHNPNLDYGITNQEKIGSDLSYGFKSTTYRTVNDQAYKCYELDYKATMIVVTGYDVVARAKVIRRWLELEQPVVVKESPTLKLEMDLVFAKAMSETLRLPESGKLKKDFLLF
ncbi:MAG: Rha family transcriptional regulator [Methylococcales bacterium]